MNESKYEIIIYWSEQDKAFLVEVPELPGCMVAVCKDHADLKIARVIPRAGQLRDFHPWP